MMSRGADGDELLEVMGADEGLGRRKTIPTWRKGGIQQKIKPIINWIN